MNYQHQSDLTQMRIFLEKHMTEQPDSMALMLPSYHELMIRLAEIEIKSLEAQSTEKLKDMDLRAGLDTNYSNNNTTYNIAAIKANNDYWVNRDNNWSKEYQHNQSLDSQGFSQVLNRGLFDAIPILDLSPSPRRRF